MAELRFTILGCGSSGGVPRLGGHWGDCDPSNPKNTRRRCSMLIERETEAGITRVLIDTSPDLRTQLLDAGVGTLDAVVYTHGHADHVHGIDDLRMIVFNMKARLPVWADAPTQERLLTSFGYAFIRPEGSTYPPILDMHLIEGDVTIDGAGGPVTLRPFLVGHGGIDALGFRIERSRLPSGRGRDDRGGLDGGGKPRLLGARRAAPHAASDPYPSGPITGMDRPRRAAPGGADQHAHRPRPRHGGRRDPRPHHPRLRRHGDPL